jgi:D-sedoheptulose 7-phosphate isomerase
MTMDHKAAKQLFSRNIDTARSTFDSLQALAGDLVEATELIKTALLNGNKMLACGNGGSACDASHFASEIAGRYVIERPGYPALDLTADHSLITALINDYPPEQVFARQVQAMGSAGDVLVAFSTSGNSLNVRLALEVASAKRISTIAFLGRDGGKCKGLADVELIVRSDTTARIQEAHLMMYHTICELLDPVLAGGKA